MVIDPWSVCVMYWDIYHLSCSDPTILHRNNLCKMEKNSKKLWLLTLVQAGFFILSATMTYLGTKETVRTEMIMAILRRMHMGPVSFHSAFYFNLGQQFFSVTIATVYILARKKI
jgi:hypothetical protein